MLQISKQHINLTFPAGTILGDYEKNITVVTIYPGVICFQQHLSVRYKVPNIHLVDMRDSYDDDDYQKKYFISFGSFLPTHYDFVSFSFLTVTVRKLNDTKSYW